MLLTGLPWLFVLGCAAEESQTYCAIEVYVTLPEGTPINLPLELRDQGGGVVERVTPTEGRARFCDIGFGPHTIEIGGERECDHVSIGNVFDTWPVPRTIRAIFNPSCGAESLVRPSGCFVALRVKDIHGGPLHSVSVTGYAQQLLSDVYGRIYFVLKWGDMAQVKLSRSEFHTEILDLHCSKPQQRLEQEVTLKAASDQ